MTRSPVQVLIVDDDVDEIELISRALRADAKDAIIYTEQSVSAALEFLDKHEQVDIVLLDLRFPGADGHEVIRQVRMAMETVHIPIVVLSGSDDPVDIGRSYYSGASAYVVKPVDGDEYRQALHHLAKFWLHHCRFFRGDTQ